MTLSCSSAVAASEAFLIATKESEQEKAMNLPANTANIDFPVKGEYLSDV